MQTLYTASAQSDALLASQLERQLVDRLKHSIDNFILSIYYLIEISEYALKDAQNRSGKYLPTADDLVVNTKIGENSFIAKLKANESLQKVYKDHRLSEIIDNEWVKKLYQELSKTQEYISYIADPQRIAKQEKAIILFLWEKIILENEELMEAFKEDLQAWEDDKEVTTMLMENLFKGSLKIDFTVPLSDEKMEYAKDLLTSTIEKQDVAQEIIEPKLKNWDSDRVAHIDLILLRMGVIEMLYFPTIPTKVTINEYIEIAKMYSTPQSGQFVNGVLDSILKDPEHQKKIQKQERQPKA